MRYTPLGWGIFSIARGKKFVKAYHGDFLRFYAGEPLLCGKQNRGLSKFKIEGKRRLLIADGIKPVYVKRDCFLYGIRWEG